MGANAPVIISLTPAWCPTIVEIAARLASLRSSKTRWQNVMKLEGRKLFKGR